MFKNLKITAKLSSPISITDNIILDTLILLGVAKQTLKDDFFLRQNTCFSVEEVKELLNPILDTKLDVFCASYGFGKSTEFTTRWCKKFHTKDDDLILFKGKGKQRVETGSGHFKNYHMPLVVKSFKEIVFFARGDKEKIKQALDNVYFIGKKSSQGYGEVREWIIEEIEEDCSVLDKNNNPMRNIPAKYLKEVGLDKILEYENYPIVPPYKREEKEFCII